MWAVLATLFVSGVVADSCQASTLLSQPPGSGTYVALKEFSYCAGSLSATVRVPSPPHQNYQKKAIIDET